MSSTWPEHAQVPSATFYLAQTLFDLKRYGDALPLLTGFAQVSEAPARPRRAISAGLDAPVRGASARRASRTSKRSSQRIRRTLAPAARQAITGTLAKHGNKTQQQSAYTQLMQQSPPTPEALYDAGLIAGRLGQAQNQDAAWRRLRKEFPNHSLAHQASLELARVVQEEAGPTPRPRVRRRARAATTRSAPRGSC